MDELLVKTIEEAVKKEMLNQSLVEIEASGRHVHLSREAVDYLFGAGYQLTKAKELSQPGQYACKERITIKGPKGKLENVVILGPERSSSQVEVSKTDAVVLGGNIPVRESGDIDGTPGVTIVYGDKELYLEEGLIVAKRHIHVALHDAAKLQVEHKEIVQVKVFGERSLIFDDVVIRVHPNYQTYMHIDFDEANSCEFQQGALGKIIKKNALKEPLNIEKADISAEICHAPGNDTEFIEKRVITERDLQKLLMQKKKKILIPKNSIVTPLGVDYAKKHKLEIQRGEENEE
ncbi:hypothetical protein GCM10011346_30650 [Oceanobacillus neutriphilus]|uniref:Phosphate propanoyltransferase n=1 Tax=Oceanobacillus neutriphilus TaxID=531815 RepID=A0ABQ2NXD8_9BACI|nr:hypothetical protein GCM10011346_30650 [Oceanobacillus neutriphilus]